MTTRTATRRTPRQGFLPSRTALPITWDEFRQRYTSECAVFMKQTSQNKLRTVFYSIETTINPKTVESLDASRISEWAAHLKKHGTADTTIKGYLAYLRAALRWAVKHGMIAEVPYIESPKRAKNQKVMKGRPITEAEFELLLSCASRPLCDEPVEIESHDTNAVRFFLRGLWLSGLRLSEALSLSWDSYTADCLFVDFCQEYPMFHVPASEEKGNTDRLLPMSPEFAQMLQNVPQSDRNGKVFKVPYKSVSDASAAICAIGEVSGIVVDAKSGKFVSAHDLRRSFGERWASRVMPAILMQLMRHESIETTMRFYVGHNAQAVAKACWEAVK